MAVNIDRMVKRMVAAQFFAERDTPTLPPKPKSMYGGFKWEVDA